MPLTFFVVLWAFQGDALKFSEPEDLTLTHWGLLIHTPPLTTHGLVQLIWGGGSGVLLPILSRWMGPCVQESSLTPQRAD